MHNKIYHINTEATVMLKILVCIKEVIPYDTPLEIMSGGSSYSGCHMNLYDEYALEEAVRIKEAFPGTVVDAFSAGPERVCGTLKKALEKGADNAFHYYLKDGIGIPPSMKASIISSFAAPRGYRLILTGVMSEDLMHGQVGPMTAGFMNIPYAASVVREALNLSMSTVDAESEIEGGSRIIFRLNLPALLTIQSGINTPRYPSLSNKLRAKKQDIVPVEECGSPGLPLREEIYSIGYPEKTTTGTVIEGNRQERADKLLHIFHEKALI